MSKVDQIRELREARETARLQREGAELTRDANRAMAKRKPNPEKGRLGSNARPAPASTGRSLGRTKAPRGTAPAGELGTKTRGAGEKRRPGRSKSPDRSGAPKPGASAKALAAGNGRDTPALAGLATGPREAKPYRPKRGRPRAADRDKTLTATQPWKALKISRATWYRKQGGR